MRACLPPRTHRFGSAFFAASLLIASLPAAAEQRIIIPVDQPLLAIPPEHCARMPASTPKVQVLGMSRIRFTLDKKTHKYTTRTGQCSSRGIELGQLDPSSVRAAPLRWDAI